MLMIDNKNNVCFLGIQNSELVNSLGMRQAMATPTRKWRLKIIQRVRRRAAKK